MTPTELQLVLFECDPERVREARGAGIDTMIVDCEWRGKEGRQAGRETEINRGSPDDLEILRAASVPHRWCRIDAPGRWRPAQVDRAVSCGATLILLPMVRSAPEVERFVRHVDRRCGCGILIETEAAVAAAAELARQPLDAVYVGLNDLAIDRGSRSLFEPLVDGTVERVREAFAGLPFGFAGATVVGCGSPIPCRLLLAEMARLDCTFTFLRRSFKRDVQGRPLATELARLRAQWLELMARDAERRREDHDELRRAVLALGDGEAST